MQDIKNKNAKCNERALRLMANKTQPAKPARTAYTVWRYRGQKNKVPIILFQFISPHIKTAENNMQKAPNHRMNLFKN